jgi:acetyl-CoA C-acetyltransferase
MGATAEKVAQQQAVSREQQDAFALLSQERAAEAIEQGRFDEQIVPIEAPRADEPFARDEHPRATTLEQLAGLKPVFQKGGSVTAGNSSGINDGAAAVLLMRLSEATRRGLAPRLLLRSWAVTGIEPEIMGYAPAMSIPKALELAGKTIDEIDVIELNEAFAAQAVAVAETLQLPAEKLNPDGGAIALGHPVGATGAILTVKLMHALERTGERWGLVSMCIGGGQGFAAVFERP